MSRIDVGKRVGARPLEFGEPSIDMLYDFHADTDRLGKLIARRRHVDADQVRVLPRGGNSSHQRCCGRLVDLMSSDCRPSVRHLSAIPRIEFASTAPQVPVNGDPKVIAQSPEQRNRSAEVGAVCGIGELYVLALPNLCACTAAGWPAGALRSGAETAGFVPVHSVSTAP